MAAHERPEGASPGAVDRRPRDRCPEVGIVAVGDERAPPGGKRRALRGPRAGGGAHGGGGGACSKEVAACQFVHGEYVPKGMESSRNRLHVPHRPYSASSGSGVSGATLRKPIARAGARSTMCPGTSGGRKAGCA